MQQLRETIRRAALSDRPVLVAGPTGSGKELVVAASTRGAAPRRAAPDLNCGAIPEALMESQLFGHERGAFTGADRRQDGYFALVRKGTLFLDEIAELSLPLQAKLLRVLETGGFRPVGSAGGGPLRRSRRRRDPRRSRGAGARRPFSRGSLYRLDVLAVPVPALAERAEDIPALVAHFVRQQQRTLRFTAEAMDLALLQRPGRATCASSATWSIAWRSSPRTIEITPEVLRPFLASNTETEHKADVLQSVAQRS